MITSKQRKTIFQLRTILRQRLHRNSVGVSPARRTAAVPDAVTGPSMSLDTSSPASASNHFRHRRHNLWMLVSGKPSTAIGLPCPVGTTENSPAIYRWVRKASSISSPVGSAVLSCLPPTSVGGSRSTTLFLEPASAGLLEELKSPAEAGCQSCPRTPKPPTKVGGKQDFPLVS